MEEGLANLHLLNEEEDAFCESAEVVDNQYCFSLVGWCLMDNVVHFSSMRNTMTDLWHPIGGIHIADLGEKRVFVPFFNQVDKNRVLFGTPWFFNNHLLNLNMIALGEDPMIVPLLVSEF